MEKEITTLAGVENYQDPAGKVWVTREDGGNIVQLRVADGTAEATAYLDYRTLCQLVLALGAEGVHL